MASEEEELEEGGGRGGGAECRRDGVRGVARTRMGAEGEDWRAEEGNERNVAGAGFGEGP